MPSKLHLNISSKPACGRQLNNHREDRSQQSDAMTLAASFQTFAEALGEKKACRHCAREVGLLPRLTRQIMNQDEVDEKLAEELEFEEEGSDE